MISQGQVVTGLLAGTLVGAVAGILLAPKPGKVVRRLLRLKVYELKQKRVKTIPSEGTVYG